MCVLGFFSTAPVGPELVDADPSIRIWALGSRDSHLIDTVETSPAVELLGLVLSTCGPRLRGGLHSWRTHSSGWI